MNGKSQKHFIYKGCSLTVYGDYFKNCFTVGRLVFWNINSYAGGKLISIHVDNIAVISFLKISK